jgi:hypothetical protein
MMHQPISNYREGDKRGKTEEGEAGQQVLKPVVWLWCKR